MRIQKKFALDDMKSARVRAKEDKETVNKTEAKQKPLDRSKAGLSNPCVFGIWNKSFNKNCL